MSLSYTASELVLLKESNEVIGMIGFKGIEAAVKPKSDMAYQACLKVKGMQPKRWVFW